MSGVKGMREVLSTSPTYAAALRAKVKAGMAINRLNNHMAGRLEMSATQVRAAEILLRKVMPDKTEAKIDANVRNGPLLTYEQAVGMAEDVIESSRHAAVSSSVPHSLREGKSP
jgi:hypothetical protein